jgi:hypothetical protein
MKKSIGLYADTRNFKTTLPQTKHLNFFMQTNPQGYANGGQVRSGIPQNNMQVTSGFLPMALGFQEGGEAFSFGEIYSAIVKVVAGYLGKSEDDPQVQDEANKIAQTDEGQELAKKILAQNTEEEYLKASGVMESQPPLPTETFQGSTQEPPFGAVDVTPDPTLPKVPSQQQQRDFEDEQKPSDFVPPPKQVGPINPIPQEKFDEEEGIRGIPTERKGGFNFEDFFRELFKDKDAAPPLPKVTEEQKKREEEDTQKGVPKADSVVPEIKPKPKPDSKGGIDSISTGTGRGEGALEYARRKTDLSKKEAEDVSNDLATLTGNKGKKDIPEWALPLASAGFAMMASKSPYFLQALGEAGQAGIATLQEQRGKEAEKADREADRKLKEAQAKYYLGEGRQTSAKTIVQNGILGQIKDGQFVPIIDSSTGEPMKQKIGRAEAIEILMKGNPNFDKLDVDEQNRQIQAVINLYNNTETIVNENLKVDDDGGFNVGAAVLDFLKIFE